MKKLDELTLPSMLRASFGNYADNLSLSYVGEEGKKYGELELEIKKISLLLKSIGVSKNDKVAILGQNMPGWGAAFFAINITGAVVVPILPDFHSNEIKNILKHADVKALFVSESLKSKIDSDIDLYVISLETYSIQGMPEFEFDVMDVGTFVYEEVCEDDLASIIYTSGTTGKSKGVMLTHKNITWTAQQSWQLKNIRQEDRFLSVLPLSHTFENTLGLILPIMFGASVFYLQKPPTASVLLPALKEVRPTIMLVVPLIVEKIYKGKILPEINNRYITRQLYKFRPTQKLLNKVAGRKLHETFGGKLEFFGVGGAKLDDQVERFLMDANFPLAIGYGMTESSPLLAGAVVGKTRYLSTGHAMPGVKLRIANSDSKTGEGEIQAKGENVMKGYYKEPEVTNETFTEDGWLKTGDLGKFDKSGYLFIKGRLKNMIVGSSGENIYPEEIESLINRMEFVLESLVIQQKGRLVALVHLNKEELEKRFNEFKVEAALFVNKKMDEILTEIQKKVNEELNKFSQIHRVVLQPVPFEKTPTQKIKRFLYH